MKTASTSSEHHGSAAIQRTKQIVPSLFVVNKQTHRHGTAVVTMATMNHQPAQPAPAELDVVPSIRGQLSLYAVSDIHCDYPANMAWVQDLPSFKASPAWQSNQPDSSCSIHSGGETWQASCCIVAGDVSDDLRVLRHTFAALKSKFDLVAFVPGNHELWLKAESSSAPRQQPHQSYLHSDDAGATCTVSTPVQHSRTTGSGSSSSSSSTTAGHRGSDSQVQQTSSNSQAASVPTDSRNGGAKDSVQKLVKVLQLCDEYDIIRQPVLLGRLLLVPLLSWHHKSFDKEPDIAGVPRAGRMTVADYSACKWPEGLPGAGQLGSEAVASWFNDFNSSDMQQPGWPLLQQVLGSDRVTQHSSRADGSICQNDPSSSTGGVPDACSTPRPSTSSAGSHAAHSISNNADGLDMITFSHFLPHQHLLPEKRMLAYPNLAKVVGSDFLWRRLKQLQPHMHIFGHSHFAWDAVLEGIRFLQAPLCYPAERQHRMRSIKLSAQPEQQQAHASIPGHDSDKQYSQQQKQPAAASAATLQQDHGVRAQRQQQQQQQQEPDQLRHDQHRHKRQVPPAVRQQQQQLAPDVSAPWLPVLVFQAAFTAELGQLDSSNKHAVIASSSLQQQQQDVMDAGKRAHSHSTGALEQSGGLEGSCSDSTVSRIVSGGPVSQSSSFSPTNCADSGDTQHQSGCADGRRTIGIIHGMLSLGGVPVLDPEHLQHVQQQWHTPAYRIASWRSTWAQPLMGLWSEHYKTHDRDPDNVQLAPWVAKRYKRSRQHQATS